MEATRLCVITREFSDGEYANGEFEDVRRRIEKVVGSKATEGVTADGKTELFFNALAEGLESLVDKLNLHDDVSLAHFRRSDGSLYPNI